MLAVSLLIVLPLSSALDLSHSQLTHVPEDIPPDEATLDLSYNDITTISTNAFISLTDLTSLVLKRNLIDTVEDFAFAGLSNLMSLDLSNNRLQRIPDVSSIVTLRYFLLVGNPIMVIEYDELEYLTYLYQLQIGWLTVRHFPPLPYCPGMTYLHLRGNWLRMYPQQFFQRLPNLKVLRLGYNKLASFPEFGECKKKLISLYIDHNRIYSIPDLSGYDSLERLDLSDNYISSVSEDIFSMPESGTVMLDGNPISCMHELCGLASSNLSAIVTFTCPDGLQWQQVDRELLCEGL